MDNQQIENLAKETAWSPSTLSTDVMKRFMSDRDYTRFLDQYRSHRRNRYATDRSVAFEAKITDLEMKALKRYMNEPDVAASQIERDLDLKPAQLITLVKRAALKLIHQKGLI